jgi:hypothetical protein
MTSTIVLVSVSMMFEPRSAFADCKSSALSRLRDSRRDSRTHYGVLRKCRGRNATELRGIDQRGLPGFNRVSGLREQPRKSLESPSDSIYNFARRRTRCSDAEFSKQRQADDRAARRANCRDLNLISN